MSLQKMYSFLNNLRWRILYKISEPNIFLMDRYRRKKSLGYNNKIYGYIKKFNRIDSIKNIEEFRELMVKYKEIFGTDTEKDPNIVGAEAEFYGHINAIYDYAGLEYKRPLYLSKILHGVTFYDNVLNFYEKEYKSNCYIVMGRNEIEKATRAGVGNKTYPIGPYIHYAKEYYDKESFEELKKKLGRTLLVFPTHTYEEGEKVYKYQKFVDDIYEKYEDDYDTIMACIYWWDIDKKIFDAFKNRGAYIVSAGHRNDYNFIRRLKTILLLGDEILINQLGTNLGYAFYMNKNVEYYYSEIETVMNTKEANEYYKREYNNELEKKIENALINKDEEYLNEIYNKYWGGNESIKTPEEMREIIIGAEKYVKKRLGFVGRYKNY